MSISDLKKRIEGTGEKKAISLNLGKIGELAILVLIGFFSFGSSIETLALPIFLCIMFLLIQLRKVVVSHVEKNKCLETLKEAV